MALNMDVLRKRLREAFGGDSQETVGKKLNMTQGNVSKLLSGSQQPTIETIYHISKAYGVSADWLMGLSEKKKVTRRFGEETYASAVEAVMGLCLKGGTAEFNERGRTVTIKYDDDLFCSLLKKSYTLSKTDWDLYRNWMELKLSLFEDKPLLWHDIWKENSVFPLADEATTESNWLETYEAAKLEEENIEEMMGDDVSPFKG